MLKTLERKLLEFIKAKQSLASAQKVLLAVSGGADSTALLHGLASLKQSGFFKPQLTCLHVNHQLRGPESDADQQFIVTQAQMLNLPIITKSIDVKTFAKENKLSIETAARELRRKCLIDQARSQGITYILTAHHADDNAETIIQRLSRGTGFRGLAGISPVRQFDSDIFFVRPLLDCTRAQILQYLTERDLIWQQDKSNFDCHYRRNFIRHKLLPAIQKDCLQPIVSQLSNLAKTAGRLQIGIDQQAENFWNQFVKVTSGAVSIDLKPFENLHPLVKIELITKSLVTLQSGQRDLTQVHYENILQLACQKASGKTVQLPNGFQAALQYGKLVFSKPPKTQSRPQPVNIELPIPGTFQQGGYSIQATILDAKTTDLAAFKSGKTSFIEWFDLEKLKLPLFLRSYQKNEPFIPLGQSNPKKIGRFLIDSKVPADLRRQSLAICDQENVIWLWPIRISQTARTEPNCRKILQLQISLLE